MYLLAKFGDHRSYRNGDVSSYIKSYMDTLGNAELDLASIRHVSRFLKSGKPIYNSEFQIRQTENQQEVGEDLTV